MKRLKPLLAIAAVIAAFGIGIYIGKTDCPVCPPADVDMSLFWETWNSLEANFVDKSKIEHQKMIYGAISGMVQSLGDPYTVFFSPEDTKKFLQDSNGSFEGVGMEIGVKRDQMQVITPLEGSPAQKAGIQAGDLIVKIDGKSTSDLSVDAAVDLIRGPKGTPVTLTLYRDQWKETRDFKLVRDVIEIPSVKLEFKDNNIAYIQLFQFSEKAVADFRKTALQVAGSPANRIVLDLRNNPGGYLYVSQDIAGWFLKKDQIVTIEESGSGKKNEYKSPGPSTLSQYPIVVLINEGYG